MTNTTRQPILVVEDCPEDFEATVRSFKKARLANPIFRCEDGDAALDFLYQRGAYADAATAPRPAIILLDLNLPGTDGREVLSQVKQDPKLKSIPVVILTTSSDPRDVDHCYLLGANTYIVKPVEIDGFFKAPQRLRDYWFEISILPDGREAAKP